jgi:nickel-type superoxide dismutase maturation protease
VIVQLRSLRAVAETGRWLAGRRRRYRVTGASMEPTLHDGEFVLVDESRRPVPGELALARHPTRRLLTVVKRVAAVGDDGYVVASDNPAEGTDSRQWGPLEPGLVVGTVVLVMDRPLASLTADAGRHGARWLRR